MLERPKRAKDDIISNRDLKVINQIGSGNHMCVNDVEAFTYNRGSGERNHIELSHAVGIIKRFGVDATGQRIDPGMASRFYIMAEQARTRDGEIRGADEDGYPQGYKVWRMVQ